MTDEEKAHCIECKEWKADGEVVEISPATRWHPPEFDFMCSECFKNLQQQYGEQARAEREYEDRFGDDR